MATLRIVELKETRFVDLDQLLVIIKQAEVESDSSAEALIKLKDFLKSCQFANLDRVVSM
jgi:hypothetical protein